MTDNPHRPFDNDSDNFPDDVTETANRLFYQCRALAFSPTGPIICIAEIAEAILAERERCAAVVENTYIGPHGPHEIRTRIAADIRKGIEP